MKKCIFCGKEVIPVSCCFGCGANPLAMEQKQMMETNEVIMLAKKHVEDRALMQTSAQLCLDDALHLMCKGDLEFARNRALKSLEYTVGIFHPDYREAAKSS